MQNCNEDKFMGRRKFIVTASKLVCGTLLISLSPSVKVAIADEFIIDIDKEECNGCGECVDVCPVDVLMIRDEKAIILNISECLGCESCVEICGKNAISVKERT